MLPTDVSRPLLTQFQTLTFTGSFTSAPSLPPDEGQEIALVGPSNVGKSSLLNALAQMKHLAYYSKTPGRTQAFNLFCFRHEPDKRIIDLPGYGYAKIPKALKAHWDHEIARYFNCRKSLTHVLWIYDLRRDLNKIDRSLFDLLHQHKRKVHLVLNKSDKFSTQQLTQRLQYFHTQLLPFTKENLICETYWPVSSKTFSGIDALRKYVLDLFSLNPEANKVEKV